MNKVWILVLLGLAACGDGSGSSSNGGSGGDTGTGGTGGSGGDTGTGGSGGAAPQCTSSFVGSCTATAGAGCVEYGGNLDAAMTQQACEQGGNGVWSATDHCDSTGAVGACVYDMAGTCSAQWYFPPFTEADASDACTQAGGAWVP